MKLEEEEDDNDNKEEKEEDDNNNEEVEVSLTEAKTNTVCICEQVFLGEDWLDLFREFFVFLTFLTVENC